MRWGGLECFRESGIAGWMMEMMGIIGTEKMIEKFRQQKQELVKIISQAFYVNTFVFTYIHL